MKYSIYLQLNSFLIILSVNKKIVYLIKIIIYKFITNIVNTNKRSYFNFRVFEKSKNLRLISDYIVFIIFNIVIT